MTPPRGFAARHPRSRLPREIRVLAGAAFMVAIGYGVAAPALPVFARSFDVSVTAASAIVSAFAFSRVVFAPLCGRIVGLLGELRVFCGGLLIVALSSTACAFAGDYGQLLVFRAAGGAGSTMFTVSAAALLIRIAPQAMRGRASAAWASGFLLGNVVGPLVGGGLMAASLRTPFLAYAGMLVGTAVVTGTMLRGHGRSGRNRVGSAAATVTFTAALRHRCFRAALSSNVVNGWTVYGIRVAIVPLFVVDALGRADGWAGVVLTAFAAGTGATLLVGGQLADRKGRRPPILAGSAVVAVTSLGLGLTTSITQLVAVSVLAGAGTGLTTPAVNAAVGDVITADDRDVDGGTALAGFQMVGDLGAIVGPVLTGVIVEMGGYPAAFATTAAIAAVSFGYWFVTPETLLR